MRPFLYTVMLMIMCMSISLPVNAQEDHGDKVKYVSKSKDFVLKEMEEKNNKSAKERKAETQRIRDEQAKSREKETEQEKEIRFSKIEKPSPPGVFKQAFHFEPSRQYLTGTCWAFSTTSYFESEVYRLTSRKIKLSEADVTHRISLRYLSGIIPKMRVNCNSRLFDIIAVINIGERSRELQLMCRESI